MSVSLYCSYYQLKLRDQQMKKKDLLEKRCVEYLPKAVGNLFIEI